MMHRRKLLGLGLGSLALLAAGAWTLRRWPEPWQQGRLSTPARAMMSAIARALLQGLELPESSGSQAMPGHLVRLEQAIAGLSPATQAELSRLLQLMLVSPGRLGLAGLSASWASASTEQVAAGLQAMRRSRLKLRRQAYQALRDLHLAAWAAEPKHWPVLSYPGPRPIP